MVSADCITSILEKLAEIGVEVENLDKDSQRGEYDDEEIQAIELKFVEKFEQELRKYWLGDHGIQDLVMFARSIITGETVSNVHTIAILPKNRSDLSDGPVKEEKEQVEETTRESSSKKKHRASMSNLQTKNRLDTSEKTPFASSAQSVSIPADTLSQKIEKNVSTATLALASTTREETKENSRQNVQPPKSHEKKKKLDGILDDMNLSSVSSKTITSARRDTIHLEVDQKRSKFPAWSIWRWREDKLDWLEGDETLVRLLRYSWNPEIFQLLNYWEPPLQGQGLLRSPLRAKALSARNTFVKKLLEKWGFKKTLYKLTPQRTKGMFWFGIGATRLDQMTVQERKLHLAEYTQPIPSQCRQNHVSNLLDLIEKMAGTTLNNKSLSEIILKRIILEDQVPCQDPILEELWKKKRRQNPWKNFLESNYAKALASMEKNDEEEDRETEEQQKKDEDKVGKVTTTSVLIDGNVKKRRGRPPLKRKSAEELSNQIKKKKKQQRQQKAAAICDSSSNIITIN